MKVFLGWSGERSHLVAAAFGDWLQDVLQTVEPWMSPEMRNGAHWSTEIDQQLAGAQAAILFVTRENLASPWLSYEAGALGRLNTNTCTFLLDVEPADVAGPLAQFQHARADQEDVRRLLSDLNRRTGPAALDSRRLERAFDRSWDALRRVLDRLPVLTSAPARSMPDILVEVLETVRVLVRDRAIAALPAAPTSRLSTSIFGPPKRPPARSAADIFVLMPFAPELRPVYEDQIRRVAHALQLSVKRADDFFTTGSIVDDVWDAINAAKILIADCTGRNPNVFYELGIAHAIGKPVILITQDRDDVPVDVRHRRYIEYEFTPRGMSEFEERLANTIRTTLQEDVS